MTSSIVVPTAAHACTSGQWALYPVAVLAEDGESIPKPCGAASYQEVLNGADVDQYFLAHVQIDCSRFAAPVRQ